MKVPPWCSRGANQLRVLKHRRENFTHHWLAQMPVFLRIIHLLTEHTDLLCLLKY